MKKEKTMITSTDQQQKQAEHTNGTNPLCNAALEYPIVYDVPVFPIDPRTKKPIGRLVPNGFKNATTDEATIIAWWAEEPTAGIAAPTGVKSGLLVLDVDMKDGKNGEQDLKQLEAEHSALPHTVTSRTQHDGRQLFFKYPAGQAIRCTVEKFAPGIDIRAEGGYVVLPPTTNGVGRYKWIHSPKTTPLAEAPEWVITHALTTQAAPAPAAAESNGNGDDDILEGNRNTELASIAGRLRRSGLTVREVAGSLLLVNKERCKPPLAREEVLQIAKGMGRYSASVDIDVRAAAMSKSGDRLEGHLDAVFGDVELPLLDTVLEALRAEESGDSRLIALMHGDRALYYEPEKQWYIFDGLHWKAYPDDTVRQVLVGRVAQVYARTAATCMELVTKGDASRRGAADQMAKRGAALLYVRKQRDIMANVRGTLAKNDDERNPATYIQWDANPDVLAVQNGVIELRTGELRPGRPDDYIKTVAPIEWEGLTARCPEWLRTLKHTHSEDVELIKFKQRLYGYSATGHTREQIISVYYGPRGRNGKGIELEVIGELLGNYALAVSKNVLVDSGKPATPSAATPHLAQLQGRRFVYCSETKKDEKADAGLLKYLSGEDTINARSLFENNGTFKPTHKLTLSTNHKPHLPAEDEATWDRITTVEYKRRYVEDPDPNDPNEFKRNPKLKDVLLAEAAGILAWVVRGSMRWYQTGLKRPKRAKDATKKYRREEDWANQWLTERCTIDPKLSCDAATLYSDFEGWWYRDDKIPSKNAFGRRLNDLGFEIANKPQRVRLGLALTLAPPVEARGDDQLDQEIDFAAVKCEKM
jgi:putative DNA primase/helicase